MTYENILLDLINEDDRFMVLTAENRAAIRNLPDKSRPLLVPRADLHLGAGYRLLMLLRLFLR